MAEHVTIYEVAPRDGLQNEPGPIATSDKVRFVDLLSACGFSHIEVTSFVNPARVPQMADAAAVLGGIARKTGVVYAALTPNLRGLEQAISAGADEVAVFASASEGFSRANIACSVDESLNRYADVADAARRAGIPVRGYVSCVTDCPYDGPTPPDAVAAVADRLIALGCREVSLGDTIGAGTPETVGRMLDAVLARVRADRLAGHFHDTHGHALANVELSLSKGLRVFDSSVGGLGGCPFAPGAKGNVATEAVVALLHALHFETGLDTARLAGAAAFATGLRTAR